MSAWVINGENKLPRACDRCHAIKERCKWALQGAQCERCHRLGHICESIRPKGRPGRKPTVRKRRRLSPNLRPQRQIKPDDGQLLLCRHSVGRRVQSKNHYHASIPNSLSELSNVSTADRQLVQRFLFQDGLIDIFSVCSSFSEKVREQVIPHLLLPRNTVLGGLLACAISWEGGVDDQADPGRLSSCYQHASSALAALASFQVTDFQAMIDCLVLGALVSTFAVRLRLNDILAICGRTLALIEPVYAVSDPGRPELRVFLSCMVMWELRGCLFSCAVPTLRFRPPVEAYADRNAGLCGTLLPLFHDICALSHALAHATSDDSDILKELDAVERSVREWQPAVPDDFTTRFSAIEISHMLCQVQSMRTAALLVIHRLRCPFGVNDEPAYGLSMTILTQIEVTYAATKQAVRCIGLALMTACLELKGSERRRWLCNISKFAGFSPQYGKHIQDALVSFWAVMDSSEMISWSDLISAGPPFLCNPS